MRDIHRRLVASFAIVATAAAATLVGVVPSSALSNPTIPWLTKTRVISSQPWAGSTAKAFDLEGAAYLPFDDLLMVADDSGDRLFAVNRTSGALVRTLTQADFAAALPVGGVGAPAGVSRADAFRAVAYDIFADSVYVFSGNCCTTAPFDPTAFRLKRDTTGNFRVESYQPLPEGTDAVAAAHRQGFGLYFGKGTKIKQYDYATNTISPNITLTGTGTALQAMTFVDPNTMLATTGDNRLVKVSTSNWTSVPGWDFDLAPHGILNPRTVAVGGVDEIYIGDGFDTRAATDPMKYAIAVLKLSEAPPVAAAFTPHVTRGPAPLVVWFIDHSIRADTHAWDLGDGTTSTDVSPAHIYANPGTYTVTLRVTGPGGSSTATAKIEVLPQGTRSGGYTLDGFGGVHRFAVGSGALPPAAMGAGYWNGWDIARGIALTSDSRGGYTLDGFGALHPFGVGTTAEPPAATGTPYWLGWDAARGVALMPNGAGGYIVDLFGGIHRFRVGSSALPPLPKGNPYWLGDDRARGITILPDGSGGYVVDRDGNLHAFSIGNGAAPPAPTGVWPARPGQPVHGVAVLDASRGGYTVDGLGGIHGFGLNGTVPPVAGNATWPGWNIARDLALLAGS